MAFFQHAKGLLRKKTDTPAPDLQIGSPNGNGLKNDADATIPVIHGLIRSQEEQAKLGDELIASGMKAMPVQSHVSAPNNNGLRDDANAAIPVKNGLVRSTEEQFALMKKVVGNNTTLTSPASLTKAAEESTNIQRRETIFKPMPQNPDSTQQTNNAEDILKAEFDDLLADLKRDREARSGPASKAITNPGDRPVPPPKPSKFQLGQSNLLNMPKSPTVASPQQPRQPVLPDKAKQILAENTVHAAVKSSQPTREQNLVKTAQSHGLGQKK